MGKILLISCLFALATADPYEYPNTLPDRQVMVHLFEWKWKDIAAECENFLQYHGYGAVQVSPPMEHMTLIQNNDMPWWVRYQPVSYKLISRSGNEEEFKDMVDRCNKVGVRIVVDTVINHMTGAGQKKGVGTRDTSGGSFFDATEGVESFPEVPYSQQDFNDYRCKGGIGSGDYSNNPARVRNCRLVGLLDLDQSKSYVQGKIIGYLNHLIDLGVAGFRVDASKHMWPADLKAIMDGTKNLREDIFGANKRAFFAHEVIDRGGEAVTVVEYAPLGRYINFNYGPMVTQAARNHRDWNEMVNIGPGYGYGNGASNDVLVFIDNHDNQRQGDVFTYKDGEHYKMAVAFMLGWSYGYPRVMSSYYFKDNNQGPPSEGPGSGFKTKSPTFKEDLTCDPSSGFVCEHRWPAIRGMAKWRSMVEGSGTENVVTEWRRLAFSRGGKGFFAINGQDDRWNTNFQTSLPQGQYCDVWSGYLKDGQCTGKTINVGGDGRAQIAVDKIVAISLASKIGYEPDPPKPKPTEAPQPKPTEAPQPKPTQGPQPQPTFPPVHYDDPYDNPNTWPNREVMVHLFEWKWKDIAAECENFLQYFGYGAVQVSPPMEHITLIQNNDMPWWVRYQPISYKLISRSGNEEEFKDMVERCNKVGVRIIVDAVINHMSGVAQKKGVATRDSSGGSFFDATEGVESFPEVPYSQQDFNDYRCKGNIGSGDYGGNPAGVRNCRLVGLLDLDQSKTYVQGKIIGYLNHLIDLGVAGFRVDASKHMWPGDLKAIMDGTKNLREDIFGANKRAFFAHEVIDRGGEAIKASEYVHLGRYCNFNYGPAVSQAARGHANIEDLTNIGPGYGYGNAEGHDVLVFVDNHDNQRSGGGVLSYKNGDEYKRAVAFMLGWQYGYPRVMSSYAFNNNDQGPPSEGPGNKFKTKSPTFNADLTCASSSGFVCEHRWPQVRGMALWRSTVQGTKPSEMVKEYKKLAFAHQGKGFFAMSVEGTWSRSFQTTLPSGQYCDVWTGYVQDGKCTGKTITVGSDGKAQIQFTNVVAISLASRIGYEPDPPKPRPTETPQPKPTEAPQPKPTQGPQPQPTFPPVHYDDPYDDPNTWLNREVMVHLFEWKWKDIAAECENFLQYFGYGAVQVSPPMEHITLIEKNDLPWWVRYQPVSYKLISRSGNEEEFKDMVDRCNKVGVRIVVDAVINHMAGAAQKKGVATRDSSGGSFFDSTDGVESFPEVPYTQEDFNDYRCKGNIGNGDYGSNPARVRNCRLVALLDLDQNKTHVQGKIIGYLNHLIDLGVAGFRVDHSKHMWPEDLKVIMDGTKNLREDIFGANKRPFFAHEIMDKGGEAIKFTEYLHIGRVINFNYGPIVSQAARGHGNWDELTKFGPGYGYGNAEGHDVLVFVDNHDNQRSGGGVLTYKNGDQYKMAVAFMLGWHYGYPRVMSSYAFNQNDQGPPSEGPGNGFKTKSPTFNADLTCASSSGFVCEHRWPQVRGMALWRSTVYGTEPSEIVQAYKKLAFAHQGKGFFAINGEGTWSKSFQTTLPSGQYCDVWTGYVQDGKCTGKTITVGSDGEAQIEVNGVVAISLASKIGASPGPDPPKPPTQAPGPQPTPGPDPPKPPTQAPGPQPTPDPRGFTKTVILLKRDTAMGQYVFIRGGTSHMNNGACARGPYQQANDKCAIPIKHNTQVPSNFLEYQAWSQGDTYLDFEGPENGQQSLNGKAASGTPLVYSSNNPGDKEYQPYNKYGRGYWIAELMMDCSKTENGWFELKGYLTPNNQWETDIHQGSCGGTVGGAAPFQSINHIAKCGAVNVFIWGNSGCTIDQV